MQGDLAQGNGAFAAPDTHQSPPTGQPASHMPAPNREANHAGPRRVMVVEDEPSIRAVVADILRFEGYDVREAGNGLEGLGMLEGWRPHVIVLDLMMPVMDGWAFAEASHRLLGGDGVPILVASASPDLSRAATTLRPFGVRAAVAKPFDVDVLLAAVEHLVQRTTADAWPA